MSETLVSPALEELVWMEPAELEAALVMVEHAPRVVEAACVDVSDANRRVRARLGPAEELSPGSGAMTSSRSA